MSQESGSNKEGEESSLLQVVMYGDDNGVRDGNVQCVTPPSSAKTGKDSLKGTVNQSVVSQDDLSLKVIKDAKDQTKRPVNSRSSESDKHNSNDSKSAKKKYKFIPKIADDGTCRRCSASRQVCLTESIQCSICSTHFHAMCRNKAGNIMDDSICRLSFLNTIRPAIKNTGVFAPRWGNFLFACNKCKKAIQSLNPGSSAS